MDQQFRHHKALINITDPLQYIVNSLGFPEKELNLFPKFFLIETINMCNAKCIMCGIDFDKKDKLLMTDELFDKIANEISPYQDHIAKVMLYLDCEPLLDKNIHSRIEKMKRAGIKNVNITTNASLLNFEKAYEIIKAGLDEIYISICSLNKDTFELIHRGLTFENIYENILNFIQIRNRLNLNLMIRIQMVLQEQNKNESESFINHWRQYLKVNDQIAIQRVHNYARAVDVMKFGDEEEINNIPCIALWGTFCIHANGEVGLCCMDTENSIPLGNINKQTISQIWSSGRLKGIREKHLSAERSFIPLCDKCTLWRESKRDLIQVLDIE